MITGGCQCGAVRYSIEGEPLRAALCACVDCRSSSGTPLVAWALFRRDGVSIEGETRAYNSSRDVHRSFCPTCGTGLFFESETMMPGMLNLRSATLDEPDSVRPVAWVQMADAPEWLRDACSLPKLERYTPR